MTAKKIKDPSRVDDHYSQKARAEGYPARSVYKLQELDAKFRLLAPRRKVLDLGCAPGSWTLYAAQKVGPQGLVLGLDLTPVTIILPPQAHTLVADLLADPPEPVLAAAPFNLVLSDLAPHTMGRREVDQARSLELTEAAWSWAERFLAPRGDLAFKIFQSQEADLLIRRLATRFQRLDRLKPQATRGESTELYAVLRGFKGNASPKEKGGIPKNE